MKAFMHKSFETLVNQYLSLDPESAGRLSALEGKVIVINLLMADLVLQLKIADKKIHLQEYNIEPADVVIKGTPLSLFHMSVNKTDRKKFFADDVTIEGNLELGQQIVDLFDEMEIDWEEHLSKCVGDVPAHQFGRFMREAKSVIQRLRESFLQNVNEYVHEEALLVPQREALNDFFHDIDVIRMDADRLEMKIKRLKNLVRGGEAL